MLFSASTLLAAAAFIGEAAAHGYVPFVRINGTLIKGWDVNTGERLFLSNVEMLCSEGSILLFFDQMAIPLPSPSASFVQPGLIVVSSVT